MQITDFLNKKNIKWFPIELSLTTDADGNTTKNLVFGHDSVLRYIPKTSDFKDFDMSVIKARQTLIDKTDYIAIDTNEVYQIDIDHHDYDDKFDVIKFNTPYYNSVRKNLPHMFVLTDDFKKLKDKYVFNDDAKIDFLTGQWAWARKDVIVHNADKNFFNLGDITHAIDHPATKSVSSSPTTSSVAPNESYRELIFDIIKNTRDTIDYREWMKIGTVMKTRLGFTVDDFLKFTNDPINTDKTIEHWNRFVDKGISPEYLWKIAKSDKTGNLTAFIAWKRKWLRYITPDILAKGSNDICIFMTPILSVKLVFCDKDWWLCNKNNIWEPIIDPTAIIVSAIQAEIDDLATNNSVRLSIVRTNEDKDAIAACEKLEKEIVKYRVMVSSVGQAAMYKNLMKSYLHDRDFINKLNSTKDKIVFKNGIWDLKLRKFEFGFDAHDYISKTLDFDYYEASANEKNAIKAEIKKICNFNDKHTEFFLSKLGYAFTGRSDEKQEFYNCTGQKASNGKSTIFEALEEIAPIYVGKIANNALEENNGKKHKTIAELHGKRIVWVDELSPKKQDTELLKLISNGTKIPYEVMYGTMAGMMIAFKLFIVSNHSLQFKMDNGLKRRLTHMQFDSVFKMDAKENDFVNRIFIADPTFKDNIVKKYKHALLGLIFDYASKYYNNEFPEYPDEWMKEKEETLLEADPFDIWFNENYVIDKTGEVSIYRFKQDVERAGFKNINPRDYFKSKSYDIKNNRGGKFIGFNMKPLKIGREDNRDDSSSCNDTDSEIDTSSTF